MVWHPKSENRVSRLERLDQKSGEKYCWAQLAYFGMNKYDGGIEVHEAKETCRTGLQCKADSITEGACWCNKFVNGELQLPQAIVPTESA
jgi:hypothetical protein